MITLKKDKLIIEISHPSPDNFYKDLKEAIIGTIQYQRQDFKNQEELYQINFTLLELFKSIDNDFSD